MLKKIKILLKNNRALYKIYRMVFSFLFRILKIFIKVDESIILINSFAGRKYDDSPKAIFEYMQTQEKYKKYKIFWAFDNPVLYKLDNATIINSNSLKYFIIALKAKYWITNSSIEKGLCFKNKNTVYINTWHGTPIKKMGIDIGEDNFKFSSSKIDYMYAQSRYDIDIFSRAFNIEKKKFVLEGLPRNDELANVQEKDISEIKEKLSLPLNKKIILYAPTFREFDRDKNGCIIASKINLEKWEEQLSEKYIVLFRAHYEVNQILGIKDNGFIYNYSDYGNLNELLKISDILISDYSSIMFDYSILERPIYSYAYDYEKYLEKRGMYLDLNKELPNGYYLDEDILLENIKNCDFEKQKQLTKKFKEKYVEKCGEARKYIDNIIK